MLAFAPAAEPLAIPALFGISLVLLAAAMLMFGLVYIFDYTIGLLMDAMAGLVKGVPFVGGIAKGGIEKAKHNIRDRMVSSAQGLEHGAGMFWHGAAQLTEYTGKTILYLGLGMRTATHNLVNAVIPGLIHDKTHPLAQQQAKTSSAAAARDRAEAKARTRGIDATTRDITQEKHARERGIDYVGTKAEGLVDSLGDRVESAIAAERRYAHKILHGELASWQELTGYAAIGGIALATLTRVFPFWQCTNFRRFSKLLCRSPIGALEDLFGLALLAIGPISIVEFARMLQDVTEEVDDAVRFFVR